MNKHKRNRTYEERFEDAIEKINNVHPDKVTELRKFFNDNKEELKFLDITQTIKKGIGFLGITKAYGSNTNHYWILRGWETGRPKYIKPKRTQPSPFSLEFWTAKGYSVEDAEYMRNSKRPIRKEYWLEKGYGLDDAIALAKEKKDYNNKKGARKTANRSDQQHRTNSKMCIEYWLSYHKNDKEKAQSSLDSHRVTLNSTIFSLENCIKKYGVDKGTNVWNTRQVNWQKTLNEKQNIEEINKLKSASYDSLICNHKLSHEEAMRRLKLRLKVTITDDIKEYCVMLKKQAQDCFTHEFLYKKQSMSQLQIFRLYTIEEFTKFLLDNDLGDCITQNDKIHKNKHGHYVMKTEKGYLRSSYEIMFYNKLIDNNIEFEIEKLYKKSSMRCDFYLTDYDMYVEIAPMYTLATEEKYRKKMDAKKKAFGCVLLTGDVESYNEFLGQLSKR
jgi:hypothetical protein